MLADIVYVSVPRQIRDRVFRFFLFFFINGLVDTIFDISEYSFSPLPMLTYRTIGGVLDMYIFMGLTPDGVVTDYVNVRWLYNFLRAMNFNPKVFLKYNVILL